jgi:asparagine synthase (glutamine-hydrolyzing)
MCGIAGIIKYDTEAPVISACVEKMTRAMAHRGPDATGYYGDGPAGLGHRRLSIIDLSETANQPMSDATGRYHIVFNGEIYNFAEVKSQLPDYPYRTHGDTEVILAAYSKWGSACLERLAGMFAFAIWDSHKQELFLARDRMGVKPLYFYKSGATFLFASEIRALLASGEVPPVANRKAITEFLQFQSVGDPYTIIEGVQSVEAGSFMIISRRMVQSEKYWDITRPAINFEFHDPEAVKSQLHELLKQSVQRRMVSDVPLGAFLSGGIDSSAVVGLMASVSPEPVNTFTVGFDEKEFDESPYANMIAKKFNTRHTAIKLRPESFLEELVPALRAMDTPSGDGVNSYVVSRAIRQSGLTVALSGVGGDELFAGYPIFKQYLQLSKWKNWWKISRWPRHLLAALLSNKSSKQQRYKQLLRAPACNIAWFYPVFRQILPPPMIADCTRLAANDVTGIRELLLSKMDALEKLPPLSQVSVADFLGYTQHTLLKDMDQMSMAVSLEVREPFFDHELIEFVLCVPDRIKYPHYPKQLLVETLGDLLPAEIVHRKKQGFLFPWSIWMKQELRSFCEEHLQKIAQRDFINRNNLLQYWNRFLQNDQTIRWTEIWLFVVLEHWLEQNGVE